MKKYFAALLLASVSQAAMAQSLPNTKMGAWTTSGGAINQACPVTGCLGSGTFYTNADVEMTTTKANTAQETGMLINLNSATGAGPIQSGSAALNNGKEGLTIALNAGANSGATWGLIVDAALASSNNQYANLQGHTTIEADTNNSVYDAAPGAGGLINGFWAGGSNALPGTAMFYGDQGGSAATFSWHYGFLLNDSKLVKDADFYSITTAASGVVITGGHTVQDIALTDNAATGLLVTGTHSNGDLSLAGNGAFGINLGGSHSAFDIAINSAAPIAEQIAGSHSTADFNDVSSSATAINIAGSHSGAAISTANATSMPTALSLAPGQSVCFDGIAACASYSTSAHKWTFTDENNVTVFSVGSGSTGAIFKGPVVQNGTP